MAKTPTNKVRLTMWTKTMKVESVGSIDDCVSTVFRGLDSFERREAALAEMKEVHERMTRFEKENKTS